MPEVVFYPLKIYFFSFLSHYYSMRFTETLNYSKT